MPLSSKQAAKAAGYNIRNAHKIGWVKRYSQIATVLGIAQMTPTPEGFAQALADWQAAQKPSLKPDGMLGPDTWAKLEPLTRSSVAPGPTPAWLKSPSGSSGASGGGPSISPPPSAGSGPAWMQVAIAQQQRWNKEIATWTDKKRAKDAEQYLDWDEAYFAASPMWGAKIHAIGDTPAAGKNMHWCAAFVNYCLHRAGYSHTGSAGAGSFVQSSSWTFSALKEPRYGCVIVVPGHVAFLNSTKGLPNNPGGDVEVSSVSLLGGNQSDRIKVSTYKNKLLRSARGSNGVTSPYLWPEVGTPNCNIDLPTAQGHHCRHIHK
ncbi:MAG: hypothetical protein R3F37_19080 [Candidatus Competibacteraceae bacterium]